MFINNLSIVNKDQTFNIGQHQKLAYIGIKNLCFIITDGARKIAKFIFFTFNFWEANMKDWRL